MGVAVSPAYRRDHWVYFFLTTDERPACTYGGAGRSAPRDRRPEETGHGGAWFSGHPSLFAGTGDTTNGALAQDRNSLAGKSSG